MEIRNLIHGKGVASSETSKPTNTVGSRLTGQAAGNAPEWNGIPMEVCYDGTL